MTRDSGLVKMKDEGVLHVTVFKTDGNKFGIGRIIWKEIKKF